MPDHSPSTDERASLAQLSQSSLPLECTSHLGFGLVAGSSTVGGSDGCPGSLVVWPRDPVCLRLLPGFPWTGLELCRFKEIPESSALARQLRTSVSVAFPTRTSWQKVCLLVNTESGGWHPFLIACMISPPQRSLYPFFAYEPAQHFGPGHSCPLEGS